MFKSLTAEQPTTLQLKKSGRIFLILFCFIIQSCGGNLTDDEHVQQAQRALEQGQLDTSVIELKNALQINPENGEARRLLGKAYIELGDAESAEKELRYALSTGIPTDTIAVPLARSLYLQRKFDEIIRESNLTDQLSPDQQAELLAIRGQSHLRSGNIDQAQTEIDQALKLNEQSTSAMLGKAGVEERLGDRSSARTWVEKAISIQPGYPEAWAHLARLELIAGNSDKAEQAYSKAIDSSANKIPYIYQRALIRIQLKNFDGAKKDLKRIPQGHLGKFYAQGLIDLKQQDFEQAQSNFEKVISQSPDYGPALLSLGTTYTHLGKLGQGEQALKSYLRIKPNSSHALLLLANIYLKQNELSDAESKLKQILEHNPDHVEALGLLVNIKFSLGEYQEALDYQKKLVALNPNSAKTRTDLGVSYLVSGESGLGLEELSKASELEASPGKADLLLALNYFRSQQYDKAMAVAIKMREKDPDNAIAYNLISVINLADNKISEARDALNKGLAVDPDNTMTKISLARLEFRDGKPDLARSIYEEILRDKPGDAMAAVQLARLEASAGNIEGFKRTLETAIEADPQAVDTKLALARYYTLINQPEQTLNVLKDVSKDHPDNIQSLVLVGAAQLKTQLFEQASATYRQLISLQPQSAANLFLLAKALEGQGNLRGMKQQLTKASELDSAYLPAQLALAKLHIQQNKLDDAEKTLQNLGPGLDNNPDVLGLNGMVATRQMRTKDAINAYRKALIQRPASSEFLLGLADAQVLDRDLKGAINTLVESLAKSPSNLDVLTRLSNIFMRTKNQPQALLVLEKLNQLQPDNPTTLNSLAWILRKDDAKRALSYAERANEIAPNQAAILDTLTVILLDSEQNGDIKRALTLAEEASKLAPDNPSISYHLALALVKSGEQERARGILESLSASDKSLEITEKANALLAQLH